MTMTPEEAKTRADMIDERLHALVPEVVALLEQGHDLEQSVEAASWSVGEADESTVDYELVGLDRLHAGAHAVGWAAEELTGASGVCDPAWLAMYGYAPPAKARC